MTMNEPNKITIQFVVFPKYIASDFKSGKLTPNEWKLYMWLRLNMNPYGITSAGVSLIRDDIFKDVSKNYIEKLLLSLRSKKYLYFEDHQGRGGSFEVRFGDLITPDRVVVSIAHYFGEEEVISENKAEPKENAQAGQNLMVESHKLMEQKEQLAERFSFNSESRQVRSSYNEHDTEHKIENHDTLEKFSFNGTLVGDFQPTDGQEARCLEIAKDVGDKYVNPLLSVLKTDGLRIIEQAWGILKEDRVAGKHIRKSEAAYLQGIINKLRADR